MKIYEIITEAKKPSAPAQRNFVAKNAPKSGAGKHKNQKRAQKQGDVKHKSQQFAETASITSTSAANVSVGAVYKNKPGKTNKNKDGTAKNALDTGANLLTGGSIRRR